MDRMKPKPKSRKQKKVRRNTSDPLMRSVKKSARSARAGGGAITNSIFSFSFFKLALTGGVVLGFTALFFISGVFGDTTRFNLTLTTNPDLERGLVGHWTFDGVDTIGSSILDRSGNGNHGTPITGDNPSVASFSNASGVTGTSFSFDIGTADTNRLVVVVADDESTGINLSGATVGGKACNLVGRANNATGAGNHSEMWYCDEDDLGASAGSVTVAITGGDAGWGTHALLFTDVSQASTSDFGIDNTSAVLTTATVTGIDVSANGLVVMAAGNGQAGTATGWTSPLTERTDGFPPSSAIFATASGIETSSQTNKSYVTTFSETHNRASAIVAVWDALTGDSSVGKVVPGNIGQAFDFDGDDDYVSTGVYPDSSNVRTMSYWIKFDDVGGNPVSGAHDGSNHRLYTGLYNSGHLFAGFGTAFTNSVVSGIAVGEWHLLTLTGDGSTARLYLDAVEKTSFSYSFSGTSSLDITPGKQNGDDATNMDGTIDDFRLYDRPLSQSEITRLYQLGATTHINTTINTNPDLENGLVAHYTFDGPDLLQNAVDRSGNSNTGFLTGFTSTTTAPGKVGQALDFNGSSDYVTILNDSSMDSINTNNALTVCAWTFIQGSLDSDQRVMVRWTGNDGSGNADQFLFWMDTGNSADGWSFVVYDGANQIAGDNNANAVTNAWQHVCGWFDGTTVNTYLDGVLQGDSNTAGTIVTSGRNIRIGNYNSSQYFDGLIDDVRVYDRALSTIEITRLYQLGATTHINTTISTAADLKEGLVVHLTFDGADVNNGVIDRSGNGNDGTLESFPTPLTATPGKIGQALLFDGVDDYVNIPWDASFELSTWTFSAWAKTFSAGEQLLLRLPGGSGWTSSGRFRVSSDGWMIFHCSDGVNSLNAQAQGFTGEEWSHILGTYDGTVVSLWVNGVYAASDSDGACDYAADPTTSSFLIGNVSGVGAFDGAIDEVRFYDHVLSTTTIERLYEFGR